MIPPGFSCVDSVDADDGLIDGIGREPQHSLHNSDVVKRITFTFDAAALGTLGPVPLEDGSTCGTTAEDRFLGVVHPPGVAAIRVRNSDGSAGLELDHLQYGR